MGAGEYRAVRSDAHGHLNISAIAFSVCSGNHIAGLSSVHGTDFIDVSGNAQIFDNLIRNIRIYIN